MKFIFGKGTALNILGPLVGLFYWLVQSDNLSLSPLSQLLAWVLITLILLHPWVTRSFQGTFGLVSVLMAAGLSSFSHPPFENDFYRYFFEGQALLEGHNPYKTPPAALFHLVSFKEAFHVGFPDLTSIYPPVTQFIFRTLRLVTGESLQAGLLLFSLLNGALIVLLFHWVDLRFPKRERTYDLVVFAVVLRESCFQYHFELWAIFPFVIALYAKRDFVKHAGYLVSFHLKLIGALGALDFFFKSYKQFVAFIFFSLLSLSLFHWTGYLRSPGLVAFNDSWLFAPGLLNFWYAFLRESVSFESAKLMSLLLGVLLITGLLIKGRGRLSNEQKVLLCLWTLLYVSPVYNAWYALWPGLLLWVQQKKYTAMVLILSPLCYTYFITTGRWPLFVANLVLHLPFLLFIGAALKALGLASSHNRATPDHASVG